MNNKLLFYLLAIGLFAGLILTYSNHFHNGFHFDDSHTIQENPYIRNIHNIPLFFKDCRTSSSMPTHQGYRPIVTTTLAVDYWLGGGLNPFYFNLTTFNRYVVQCILIFFVFLALMNAAKPNQLNKFIALFATGWYALHTSNAETINYIISRSDQISTLAVVASLTIYVLFPKIRKWHIYLLPAMVGMFAKETTIMFAPILLAYILLFDYKLSLYEIFTLKSFTNIRKAITASLPAFIICVALAIFSIKMTLHHEPGGVSSYYYMLSQPFVIVHYFITFFLPVNLSADTDWGLVKNIFDDRVIVGVSFIILMIAIAFRTSSKQETKPIAFGIIWFFLALLPTSSVIPLAEVLNDHRIFFPFVGLMLSVCWSIGLLIYRFEDLLINKTIYKTIVITSCILILAGNAYGTYQRNKIWKTEESLWYDVTIKSPQNGRGLMNYGLTQMSKGNYPAAKQYFEKALIYIPYYSFLHTNLGILSSAMGKPVEAEEYFKRSIQYGPNYNESYYYYAKFLSEHFRKGDAIEMLNKALQINPAYLDARYLLMDIYTEFKFWDKLGEVAEQTLAIVPNDPVALRYLDAARGKKDNSMMIKEQAAKNPTPENYLNLSLNYYQSGQFEKCIEACKEALKLKPDYADAYNNICSAYNAMGKWDEAAQACQKALSIKPDYQLAKNNLSWALSQKDKGKK